MSAGLLQAHARAVRRFPSFPAAIRRTGGLAVCPSPTVDFGKDFDTLLSWCIPSHPPAGPRRAGSLPNGGNNHNNNKNADDIAFTGAADILFVAQLEKEVCRLEVDGKDERLVEDKADTTIIQGDGVPIIEDRELGSTDSGAVVDCAIVVTMVHNDTSAEVTGDINMACDSAPCDTKPCDTEPSDTKPCDVCPQVSDTVPAANGDATSQDAEGKVTPTVYPCWVRTAKVRRKKQQGACKKWRGVGGQVALGFDYVRPASRGCFREECDVMDAELEKFEEAMMAEPEETEAAPREDAGEKPESNNRDADKDDAVKLEDATGEKTPTSTEPEYPTQTGPAAPAVPTPAARLLRETRAPYRLIAEREEDDYYYGAMDMFTLEWRCVTDNVLSNNLVLNDYYVGGKYSVCRLRRKRKWTVEKAHKQVKSKHCETVANGGHQKALYIHCRLVRRMRMEVERSRRMPSYPSIRRIDRCRGHGPEVKLKGLGQAANAGRPVLRGRAAGRDRGDPPPPALALNAYNADFGLEADLVNILMAAQNRELTPEDYELLLRLDERVAPKTVAAGALERLPTAPATGEEGVCSVCLEAYVAGQLVKTLPCGHGFHAPCIDNWLNNSSMNCPLDGLEVNV